jgi:hypothetical protein
MELKYTSKGIAEIEEELGTGLAEGLQDFSMKTIVLFVKKGLGVDEDKAYEAIDEYIKEKDTMELYLDISEKLQDSGFLSRKADFGKIRKKIDNQIEDQMEAKLEEK